MDINRSMKLSKPDDLLPSLSFFGDSSSRDSKFMVAGGFAVSGNRISEIEDRIALLRDDAGIKTEFHWSAYRGGARKAAYEALMRYAFDLVNKRQAALHLIVADFGSYNHKAKDGENRDTSINRMYYQLCLHRLAKFYGKMRAIHVRLDAGNDCRDICAMRNQLCADSYKKVAARPNCIRTIEPVNSKNVGIIQMTDIIVGAVAAKQNNIQHLSAKGDLANFVLQASGRHSWAVNTAMDARFLTVWHHTPK